MPKVTYTKLLGPYGDLRDLYAGTEAIELTTNTTTRAVYTDPGNGNMLSLFGKEFTYDGDFMTGGTIKTIIVADEDGNRYATISKGNWDPTDLLAAYFVGEFEGMVDYVLQGRDKVTGSRVADDLYSGAGKDVIRGGKGHDIIDGGSGNDKLYGEKGSDTFYFLGPDHDNDVIYDFDAKGGGKKQDYLAVQPDHTFELVDTKRGIKLDFDSGDSVVLIGVHKLNDADFVEFM